MFRVLSYFWQGQSDDNKQKMGKPMQLVYNIDRKLQLNPEALQVLQSIEVPMVVVVMVGAARTGKSYLMNCLAGDRKGFTVDSTLQTHTKGIWMWCRSLPERPNEVLLLLDTEGLGDAEKGDSQNDNLIYSLAILLSSVLIYNGQRNIDQRSLQDLQNICTATDVSQSQSLGEILYADQFFSAPVSLSGILYCFVTELSKRIQMKAQPDDCDSREFVRFFPEFVWVLRDLTLDMHIDGKDVTPNEYLEHSLKLKDSETSEQDKEYNELRRCIRNHFPSRYCFAFPTPTFRKKLKQLQELEDKDLDEEFVTEWQNLINYIYSHKKVKRVVGGQLVTGRRFAELTKVYMSKMADGFLPCVESSVAKLAEVENKAAVDEALKFYDNEMKNISESDDLTMSRIIEHYNMKSSEAFNIFHKRSMNNNIDNYIQQLEETMRSTYMSLMTKIKEKSQDQCKAQLEKVMESIKKNLTSGHYQKPGGYKELKKDLDNSIKEYEEKTKNQIEGWAVLNSFLEEEKSRLDQVQEMDNKLTEEQKHVSDLEEELSRIKEEMEKMEQNRKAAEERRAKEIIEQIRKKFEEGKKYSMEELEEAMEHMKSEMEKYRVEGRMEDAESAQKIYEYLKEKHEETTKWSFINFIHKTVFQVLFSFLKGFVGNLFSS